MTIFYTAPTAIRACMKWGAEYPRQARPLVAAPAGHGRRADQPEGMALVLEGDRRRALPGRRHLVADRDRRHHDHDRCPGPRRRSRARRGRRCPGSTPRCSTRRATRSTTSRACWRCASPWPGMLRTLYKEDDRYVETYFSKFGDETYFVGDAARKDDGWLLLGDRPRRRRDQRLRPPALDRRGRVGDRLAPQGRRGGRDRPGRRGHRPVDLRLRHPRGRPRGHRRAGRRDPRARRRARSASSRGRSGSSGPTTCRRRARARSCAGCCATSPRAASSAT